MTDERSERPKGCYFDAYGADEEMLRSLDCGNCPLPALVCDYKGWAALKAIAERVKRNQVHITSEP